LSSSFYRRLSLFKIELLSHMDTPEPNHSAMSSRTGCAGVASSVKGYRRVKGTNQVGKVVGHDPEDSLLAWKLDVDGVCDWFAKDAVEKIQTHIDVSGKQLNDSILAKALEPVDSRVTVSLDLGINSIGIAGAQHLAEFLRINTVLQKLDLRANQIGDEGVVHLVEALKSNSSLTELDLRRNNISDAGAVALASLLDARPSIEKIDLQNNHLSPAGLQAMIMAVNQSGCMTEIDCRHNFLKYDFQIEAEGMAESRDELLEALRNNCNRPKVLTLQWSIADTGSERLKVMVTSLAGEDLAEHTTQRTDTLTELKKDLNAKIGFPANQRLELVLTNGKLIEDSSGVKPLGDLLGSAEA